MSAAVTWRRLADALRCLAPALGLVLLPKCPACLAGYFALATGLGVSITTARHLRWGLIVACVGALIWAVVLAWRRWRSGTGACPCAHSPAAAPRGSAFRLESRHDE